MGPNPLLTTVQEIAIGLGIGFLFALPTQFPARRQTNPYQQRGRLTIRSYSRQLRSLPASASTQRRWSAQFGPDGYELPRCQEPTAARMAWLPKSIEEWISGAIVTALPGGAAVPPLPGTDRRTTIHSSPLTRDMGRDRRAA